MAKDLRCFFASVVTGKSRLQTLETWDKDCSKEYLSSVEEHQVREQVGHTNPQGLMGWVSAWDCRSYTDHMSFIPTPFKSSNSLENHQSIWV